MKLSTETAYQPGWLSYYAAEICYEPAENISCMRVTIKENEYEESEVMLMQVNNWASHGEGTKGAWGMSKKRKEVTGQRYWLEDSLLAALMTIDMNRPHIKAFMK
jgi:hypothetical protein